MKKKLPANKKHNRFEYLLINLFVFAGIGLISFFFINISLFNQFTQAFKDFTFTDIYYSKISNQSKIYNGPLVLVNVENKSREEIAFLLQRLEEGKPKVIGIDIIFRDKKDSAGDETLQQTLGSYSNIVLPYIASFDTADEEVKNHEYFKTKQTSFVNILGGDSRYSTIRYYYPEYNNIPAFTTQVMQMFDSSKADLLFKKGQHETEIKYYGNIQNFKYQTFDEVMKPTFNPDVLKDKIILLGYMGSPNSSSALVDEDRFFTPLNPRLSGRSYPDMYGSIIHANILRMALDKDFIYSFPKWLNLLVAFLLSLMLLPVFVFWYVHKPFWYHLMLVLTQFAISILFLFFTILLYSWANVKIESASLLVAILFIGDFLMLYHHLIKYLKFKRNYNFHSKFFEGAH